MRFYLHYYFLFTTKTDLLQIKKVGCMIVYNEWDPNEKIV